MSRVYNWQSRLAETIKQHQRGEFAWGISDCCIFTSDCIEAVMGFDPAAGIFRGKYASMKDAIRLTREFTGGGGVERLAEVMAAQHGFLEVAPTKAQRGDVGLWRMPDDTGDTRDTLGVCIGTSFAFIKDSGMLYLPPSACARCWSIS